VHSLLISTQPTATIRPMYVGFNSNPNQTNGLISPHDFLPQKQTLTTKQPKNSGNHIIMVTSARHSPVGSILKVSKITLRCTIKNNLRNTAMQILYVQLTFHLFFLLLFYASWLSALVD
jgi:hypothetical protein